MSPSHIHQVKIRPQNNQKSNFSSFLKVDPEDKPHINLKPEQEIKTSPVTEPSIPYSFEKPKFTDTVVTGKVSNPPPEGDNQNSTIGAKPQAFKIYPNVEIPSFSGNRHECVELFLQEYELVASIYDWSTLEIVNYFPYCLNGEAFSFYLVDLANILPLNFNEMKEKLKKAFPSIKYTARLEYDVDIRKQQPNQSTLAFIYKLIKDLKFLRGWVNESELMSKLRMSLLPDILNKLMFEVDDCDNLEQCLQYKRK